MKDNLRSVIIQSSKRDKTLKIVNGSFYPFEVSIADKRIIEKQLIKK